MNRDARSWHSKLKDRRQMETVDEQSEGSQEM